VNILISISNYSESCLNKGLSDKTSDMEDRIRKLEEGIRKLLMSRSEQVMQLNLPKIKSVRLSMLGRQYDKMSIDI